MNQIKRAVLWVVMMAVAITIGGVVYLVAAVLLAGAAAVVGCAMALDRYQEIERLDAAQRGMDWKGRFDGWNKP